MRKSYLIIKLSSLGDVIQSLYVSRYLKEQDPKCFITWLVDEKFENLVQSVPYIDETLSVSTKDLKLGLKKAFCFCYRARKLLRKRCFDVLFDLQGNSKSGLMTLLSHARLKVGFSKACVSEWPNLFVTHKKITVSSNSYRAYDYLELVQKFFEDNEFYKLKEVLLNIPSNQTLAMSCFLEQKKLNSNFLIMVCPHSNWASKKLSFETLVKVLKKVRENFSASFLFIYGNKEEKALSQKLKDEFKECSALTGSLSVSVWYFLMSRVNMVFSMDSSALHLAALANTPTFSVFGPSSSKLYAPKGKIHGSFEGICPYRQKFLRRCKNLRSCPDYPCMSQIDEKQLIDTCITHIYENVQFPTHSIN